VIAAPVVVSWRFGREGEAPLPAIADALAWLSESERARAATFKIAKRRHDWLIGRLNLKALLVELIDVRYGQRCLPAHIVIARLPSGAPAVRLADAAPDVLSFAPGAALPLCVSNSHSDGVALAAASWVDALDGRTFFGVGADLERVEPRSDGFVRDFLTPEERRYCAEGRGEGALVRPNLVWSAKEAVLKVLQLGLSADTWWLTCLPDDAGQAPTPSTSLRVAPSGWSEPSRGATARRPPADDAVERAPTGALSPEFELRPEPETWRRFDVTCDPRLGAGSVRFAGRWRRLGDFVATVAVGTTA